MSISLVNVVDNVNTAAATSISAPAANHIAGNLLVVAVGHGTNFANDITLSDTAGNTYTEIIHDETVAANLGTISLWYCANCLGNANNVVKSTFPSATFNYIYVFQYSGCGSSPLDTSAKGVLTTSGTVLTSASFSTVQNNEVIVCVGTFARGGGSMTPGSGYKLEVPTLVGLESGVQDKQTSTTQVNTTASMSGSNAGTGAILVATFKAASQAATAQKNFTLSVSASSGGTLLSGYTVPSFGNLSGPLPSGWNLVLAEGFDSGFHAGESVSFSNNSVSINCTTGLAHTGSCVLDSFITKSYNGYGLKVAGSSINAREIYLSYWRYTSNSNPGFGHVYVDWYQMTRTPAGHSQGEGIIPDNSPSANNIFGGLNPESSLFGALVVTPPPDWSKYGASFAESPGTWVQIEQHLKINDPGLTNGDYEWWQNGTLVLSCNAANNCPSANPGNFVGSADYAGADLYVGGDWGALNFFTDATHTACAAVQTAFGLNATMTKCACPSQCPPNGIIPSFHLYIDDVIILKR